MEEYSKARSRIRLQGVTQEEIGSSVLTPAEKEVAGFFYINGLSVSEISKERKRSDPTISIILNGVDRKIMKLRKKNGYEEPIPEKDDDSKESLIERLQKAEEMVASEERDFAQALNKFSEARKKFFGDVYEILLQIKKD